MSNSKTHPSWCCQLCGAHIGWLGRFFSILLPKWHRCGEDDKPNLGI